MTSVMVTRGYGRAEKQLKADPEPLLKPRLRPEPSKSAEADSEAEYFLIRIEAVKTSLLDSVCPLYLTYS